MRLLAPGLSLVLAAPGTVTRGAARFTALTERLLRIEWVPDDAVAKDHDQATLMALNRTFASPVVQTGEDEDGCLTLKTDALSVKYCHDRAPADGTFSAESLNVTLAAGPPGDVVWYPGKPNPGQLAGTIRTLDGTCGGMSLKCEDVNSQRQDLHCAMGVISRDGWALVDDTRTGVWAHSPDSKWPLWSVPREADKAVPQVDWYLFAYGLDFKQALQDYVKLSGPIPMLPKFALGLWYSRWFGYSDLEMRDIVQQYEDRGIPLDVLVLDMDWHTTFYGDAWWKMEKDQAGQQKGWTGYTWNEDYFPEHSKLFDWCAAKGIANSVNLHLGSGVQPTEDTYPVLAEYAGIDPETKKYVPVDFLNETWVDGFFKHTLHASVGEGIDVWWVDWQQGEGPEMLGDSGTSPGAGAPNPTFWLNYLTHQDRRWDAKGLRSLILSRWGGLGSHRYPVGFSGDVIQDWSSLEFQVVFTATASNVAFAYWSHDIGGFMLPVDPELYVRWVQFGTLSPILRTHSSRLNAEYNLRDVWSFPPESQNALRRAMLLRAELFPYLYTAARIAHLTGVGLARPLYYEWPEEEDSYTVTSQYMLGDDLLAVPVTKPVEPTRGVASVDVFYPPGVWASWEYGEIAEGPWSQKTIVNLEDVLLFARGGAVVPVDLHRGSGKGPHDHSSRLDLRVFPGGSRGTTVYEDDGMTKEHEKGAFSETKVEHEHSGNSRTIRVHPSKGDFKGMSPVRSVTMVILGCGEPTSVVTTVGGNTSQSTHSYDVRALLVKVEVPEVSRREELVVEVQCPDVSRQARSSRIWRGALKAKRTLDNAFPVVLPEQFRAVTVLSQSPSRVMMGKTTLAQELAQQEELLAVAELEIRAIKLMSKRRQLTALAALGIDEQIGVGYWIFDTDLSAWVGTILNGFFGLVTRFSFVRHAFERACIALNENRLFGREY
mmetsp:Transcript_40633/g.97371  ORF Transcript_40633/g.97371 Transcript_40633/m.97371 type:complete len:938 (+) Transcript_40633:26-2839(+)